MPDPTTTAPETSAHRQETDMTETHTPPVSDRDRLAEFAWERLAGPGSVGNAAAEIRYSADRVADIAVAAGWRSPARVITDPAELDELPEDSVVLAVIPEVEYGKTPTPFLRASGLPSHWWGTDGHTHETATLVAYGPVTVLHIPTEAGR